MGLERLRNVKTGEVRDAETNSDEYIELINEVYDHDGSARPKWEITGTHHVRRMDDEEHQVEDFGYEHKPVPGAEVDISQVGPEQHPERALTPGEIESGIESYEQKMEGLVSAESVAGNAALANAEPLEKSDPADRAEKGAELAGSEGGKKRSSRATKKAASSGSSSGSSSSASSSGSGS